MKSIRTLALPKSRMVLALWLVVALAATVFIARLLIVAEQDISERRIFALGSANTTAIQTRMQHYELALSGLASLMSLDEPISQVQIRTYALNVLSDHSLPGLKGIGFIEPVDRADLSAFVEARRQEGMEDFVVYPITNNDQSLVISVIEPLEQNLEALGLDISFEEDRRSAAIRARNTGRTALTSSINLVQGESQQAGFVLLTPVYRAGAELQTESQRLEAFKGWVFAPLNGEMALSDLSTFENQIFELAVYDGDQPIADKLIYKSEGVTDLAETFDGGFQSTLTLFGRTWTIQVHSTAQFQSVKNTNSSLVVLVAFAFLVLVPLTLILSQDIRRRRVEKQVEDQTKELRSQVSLTQSLVDGGLLSIFVFDEDGNCLLTNDSAEEILRFSEGKFDRAEFFLELLQVTKLKMRGLIRLPAKDGDAPRILSVSREDWGDSQGEIRKTVVVQDSTSEYSAIKKAMDAEARLNLALGVSDIGVFEIDLETGQSVVSDTWKRIMRVPKDFPSESHNAYFHHCVVPEDLEQVKHNDKMCVLGNAEVSLTEFRVRLDGGIFWMRSEAVVSARDSSGRPTKMLGTQIDITERKMLETAKSDFVATVSHELRTPITSVKGAVQLLNHKLKNSDDKATRKLIHIAMSNVEHLVTLVNDILDFEQVHSDRMSFAMEDLAVPDLIEQAAVELESYAQAMNARIEIDSPVPDATIRADQQRLMQVLRNLISNACKFSPDNEAVVIGATVVGDSCCLYVRDQGPGITTDFLPQLFQPFAQADRSDNRKTNGTGLGLSISRRFVDQMGGDIGYQRIDGSVTEFWVSFEVVNSQSQERDVA